MERNVGNTDRIVRIGLGALALLGAAVLAGGIVDVGGALGGVVAPLLLGVVGVVLVVTGYTQTCPAYGLLGVRTLRR